MLQEIIIYTTPTCAYCQMAKNYFAKKNLKYIEKDVSSDLVAQKEMLKKAQGNFGVPVIDVNGKIIIGFNTLDLESALS